MRDLSYDATVGDLQRIVRECADGGDRAGLFAAMYLAVTRTVRRRAEEGRFSDAARMERFVSSFAGRYLDAYEAWRAGDERLTGAWEVAFEASRGWRPIVLQHLLLGMNAHINLDLGVTAAAFADAGVLDAVRADFDAVNDVLGELVDGCQGALGQVSPWLGVVDRIGGGNDEGLIRFSLVVARRQAWSVAIRLAPLSDAALDEAVDHVDAFAVSVGRRVRHPGLWASTLLLAVRLRERTRPADVMALLAAVAPDD